MRLSFAFAVSAVAVVAVHAGVIPAMAGGKGAGHAKGGSDGDGGGRRVSQEDRFHLQSSDGQYVFGHTTGNQGRAELRAKDGTVTGYYSYTGGDGRVVFVNYVADKNGYRVLSNTGVPSASVTIEGGAKKEEPHGNNDLQKVFEDFTARIKEKVMSQTGQQEVDLADEGQHQMPVDPTKEVKPSKHDDKDQFLDWNQVKMSTTQKPMDVTKPNEGQQQQQQEIIDPNWDAVKITTQKPSIKGRDYDGQESSNNDQWSIGDTVTASEVIPLVPTQPEIPTNKESSDVIFPEDRIKEATTEIADSKTAKESTVTDDAKINAPVTESVSITINDVPTTVSYNDSPNQQPTRGDTIGQESYQITMSGEKQFEESSTALIPDDLKERSGDVKGNEENIEIEEAVVPTTIGSLIDNETFENVPTTEDPTDRFQTTVVSAVEYTTAIGVLVNENVEVASASPVPEITTYQTESKFGDTEKTGGIQYVTEKEEDKDLPEFRTLEPTDRIGTTMSPEYGQSEVQEQEIVWPQIPQQPIPQVLVPLTPYSEEMSTKNRGVKTQLKNLRPARQNELNGDKPFSANVTEPVTTTTPASVEDENTTFFNFPRYFLTG